MPNRVHEARSSTTREQVGQCRKSSARLQDARASQLIDQPLVAVSNMAVHMGMTSQEAHDGMHLVEALRQGHLPPGSTLSRLILSAGYALVITAGAWAGEHDLRRKRPSQQKSSRADSE